MDTTDEVDAEEIAISCEPCLNAGNKDVIATHYCDECDEYLCDCCTASHKTIKATRSHNPISVKEKKARDTKFCEPCEHAGKTNCEATNYCKECDELLCKDCTKTHSSIKATKSHGPIPVSQMKSPENIEMKCEPCEQNGLEVFAKKYCKECEELLCRKCTETHTTIKATKLHRPIDISAAKEFMHSIQIEKCQQCEERGDEKPAKMICNQCKDMLCDDCMNYHKTQKIFRNHTFANVDNQSIQKGNRSPSITICDSCQDVDDEEEAIQFCLECETNLCSKCCNMHQRNKILKSHVLTEVRVKKEEVCTTCFSISQSSITAVSFCKECEEFLCQRCKDIHLATKALKSHLQLSVTKGQEFLKSIQKNCEPCTARGKQNKANGFCQQCEFELLCTDCIEIHKTQKSTRGHNVSLDLSGLNEKIDQAARKSSDQEEDDSARNVAPGIPTATDIGADYVVLTWDAPSNFKQGDYYQVWYKDVKGAGKWKTYNTEFDRACVNIREIKSNNIFSFRVRVVTENGEGPYSPDSEEITTKPSPASRILSWGKKLGTSNISPLKYLIPATEIQIARNAKAKTRKFDVGTPPPATSEKTIMLIGATGTGKSTLVDGIVNYVLGVNWDDNFRFTIVDLEDEEKSREENQSLSQTEWITCYAIHPQDGSRLKYILNIIDTPGFGDTRGLKRDQEIVEQIRHLFSENGPKGVSTIDAVCFLIKAPDARLTAVQSYIFQQVMSLFGKDIANNICSLITFADGISPPVLAALKASDLPFGKSFTFNNSGLFAENDVESNSLSPMFWEMGVKSFRAFFKHLDTVETKSLRLTKDVLDDRFRLESTVMNLQPTVDAGLIKINALKQEIKIFRDNEDIIKDNKDFEYTVTTVQQKRQELPRGQHVTNCTHCHWTCHENCVYANDEEKSQCCAMDDKGNCKLCPDKCHWQKHANTPYIFKYVDVTEKKTYAEKLKKYQAAEGKKLNQEQIFEKMAEELDDMVDSIEKMMLVVKQCNERLAAIALRPNPLSMTEHIDLMIENEKMLKKNGFQERITTLNEFKRRAQVSTDVARFHVEAQSTLGQVLKNKGKKGTPDVKSVWHKFTGLFGAS